MSSSLDTWGEPNRGPTPASASGSSGGSRSKLTTPAVVRDDWEMDEDEEEDNTISVDERNKQIWEAANAKEHHPMPALVISRGSSSASAAPSLPLNQPPTMRILKRPSPSQSPSQSSTNVNSGESFQQREARYQAARERIFGGSNEGSPDVEDKKKNSSQKSLVSPNPTPSTATTVVREPRGPSSPSSSNHVGSENKGFGERRAKRAPPPSTAPSLSTTVSISPSNTPA